jgi:hypothetical protein
MGYINRISRFIDQVSKRLTTYIVLVLMLIPSAVRALDDYRYVEGEAFTSSQKSEFRDKGFTPWMKSPSHGRVAIVWPEGWLEYSVKGLINKPYNIYVRSLAISAIYDIYWDGAKVGTSVFPEEITSLQWTKRIATVTGGGDHVLRLVPLASNTNVPYVDVILLTTNPDYLPGMDDQDFQSFSSYLPPLIIKGKSQEMLTPVPAKKSATPETIEISSISAPPFEIGINRITIKLKNLLGKPRSANVAASIGNGKKTVIPISLPADSEREIVIACDANLPGKWQLNLSVVEQGKSLINVNYAVSVANPISISADEYAYSIGTKKAVWKVVSKGSAKSLGEIKVHISMKTRLGVKPLQNRNLSFSGQAVEAGFEIGKLTPGRYVFISKFIRQGNLMLVDKREFTIFRPVPLDVWEPITRTEARGDAIYVNGKPFLGRLLSHAGPKKLVRNQGFNLVPCAGWDPDPRGSIQSTLDACAKAGMWGSIALFNNGYYLREGHFDLEHIQEAVLKWKDHPALWGWDIIDEPDVQNVTPEEVAKVAELIRKLDPNHIVWVNLCMSGKSSDYLQSQDLWSYDYYPLPSIGPFGYQHIWLDITDKEFRGKRPIGTYLQTYSAAGDRMPTPDELRSSCYLHIIHGYKWFGYYSYSEALPYGCLARDPDLWSSTRALNSELRKLAPVILDEAAFAPVSANLGPEKLQAVVKMVNGKSYLIAVSGIPEPAIVQINIDGKVAVELFGEERKLPIKNGMLKDDFAPYDAKVYEIR